MMMARIPGAVLATKLNTMEQTKGGGKHAQATKLNFGPELY